MTLDTEHDSLSKDIVIRRDIDAIAQFFIINCGNSEEDAKTLLLAVTKKFKDTTSLKRTSSAEDEQPRKAAKTEKDTEPQENANSITIDETFSSYVDDNLDLQEITLAFHIPFGNSFWSGFYITCLD